MRLVKASLILCGLVAAACSQEKETSSSGQYAEDHMTDEMKQNVPQYLIVKVDQKTGQITTAITNEDAMVGNLADEAAVDAFAQNEARIFGEAQTVTVLQNDEDKQLNGSTESWYGWGYAGGLCGLGVSAYGCAPVSAYSGCGFGVASFGGCGPYYGFGGSYFGYGYLGGSFFDGCLYNRYALSYLTLPGLATYPFLGFNSGYNYGYRDGYGQGFGDGFIYGTEGTAVGFYGAGAVGGAYPYSPVAGGAYPYGNVGYPAGNVPYQGAPYQGAPYQGAPYQGAPYSQQGQVPYVGK